MWYCVNMSDLRSCAHCGKPISKLYRASQKFCSSKCFGASVRKPMQICEQCGQTFPYRKGSINRFCSYACANENQRTGFYKLCEVCRTPFRVVPSKAHREFTCSHECRTKRLHRLLTCRGCGKTVEVRTHIVESGKYKGFCSAQCFRDWQKGKNHSNWQGGHEKWRGPNWRQQKKVARKRDDYTCQKCRISERELGRPLDVHHIKPWKTFGGDWEKANQLDNLISYCPNCHTSLEPRNHHSRTSQQGRTNK